jgi:hypothetical protein
MESSSKAKILVDFVLQSVGKRQFLKVIEEMFGLSASTAQVKKERKKSEVTAGEQCVARVKGVRTGLKVGRHVLFEAQRCEKREKDSSNHLCAVHTNQVAKFGQTLFGLSTSPLTDDQRKVFVDT